VEQLRASIAEKDATLAQKDAVVAQQAAALAQQAAALMQQAAAIDELIPHPPSDVWAESHFAEHATLYWTPRATGAVAF
jgi:hypothetical protein